MKRKEILLLMYHIIAGNVRFCTSVEMLKITGSAITGVHLLAKTNGIDKPAKYVKIIKTATG